MITLTLSCLENPKAKIFYVDDANIERIKESLFRLAERHGGEIITTSEIRFNTYTEMQNFSAEWVSKLSF